MHPITEPHRCVCVCCSSTYRMSVADSGDVFTGSAVLHGQSSFINHLSCSLQEKKQLQVSDKYKKYINASDLQPHWSNTIIHNKSKLIFLPGNVNEFIIRLLRRIYSVCFLIWGSYRSEDVRSQHPVCLLVAEDLHHSVCVGVGFGSAVGCEGELADFVRDVLRRRSRVRHNAAVKHCSEFWYCVFVLVKQKLQRIITCIFSSTRL